MDAEEIHPNQVIKTGPAAVYLIGLFMALVSGSVFLAGSLFFMESGDELCRNRPTGDILSNPDWSCDFQLSGFILGVGLFGLYSLPYGLIAAWIGDRWKILGNPGFPRAQKRAERPLILIFFPLIAGLIGAAVLFPVLMFLFPLFELLLIPVVTIISAGIGVLIFFNYSKIEASSGNRINCRYGSNS